MSITKAVYNCRDQLDDARKHVAELEMALSESQRISRSWKAQWENLLQENTLLKKDNAYLIDQLPIQKQQQYDSGMEFATKKFQECIKELEEELTLNEETMGIFNVTEGRICKENTSLRTALSEIREVWAGSESFIVETGSEKYLQRLVKQCYEIAVEALK